MSTTARLARLLAAANGLLLASCGDVAEHVPEREVGEAFPNQRRTFVANGALLGYVANRYSDDVSVLDLDAMIELGRPSVGRDPVDVDGPRQLTLDRERGLAYVVLSYPFAVRGPHVEARGVSVRAGYVMALAVSDLRPLGEFRVQASPSDLALSDDGARLAVSHYDEVRASDPSVALEARRAALGLIEPAFGVAEANAAARFVSLCVAPAGIAYGKDASRAYVACTGEDSLAVVDTLTAQVLARVPAGGLVANKPFDLSADSARRRLILSNQVAGSVVVFPMDDAPAPIATTFVTGVPFGTSWLDDSRFLVALQDPDGVAVVDANTGAVLAEKSYALDECQKPSAPTLTADGRLYLVCEGDHYASGRVVRLDPSSLAMLSAVSVGINPDRMAVLSP